MSAPTTNQPEEQTPGPVLPIHTPSSEQDTPISKSSDLRQPEQALLTNEAYFRQVWETTTDALALSNAEGILLAANPAYLRLYGYSAEQLIGQHFARIFPLEQQAWAGEQYKSVFASDTVPPPFEAVVHRADGTVCIVEACATFLTIAGRRTAMLSTIRDITERKQVEERLQVIYRVSEAVNRAPALEQIYAAALDALIQILHVDRVAILLVDEAGVMRFKAWHGLSAAYRDQAEGHALWATADLQPQPILIPSVSAAELGSQRLLNVQEGIGALVLIPLVEQGRLLGQLTLAYNQPTAFPAVELQWAQTIGQHVAHALQRKAAETQLRQLNATLEQRVVERTAALEQRNQELDQFAYVASHDLKAPLRALRQLTTWISQDAAGLSVASQTHLRKVRSRIQHMEQLLNDLLAYSRAGRQRYAPEQVDLTALVRTICEFLAPPPRLTIVAEQLPLLRTERVPLETVLRNLIGNAIQHHDHPQAGHISITVTEQEAWVTFSITDDGPGIAAPFHERIFQAFQTGPAHEQAEEGSGLGLAIVKKVVESRGGTITVESAIGQGATFRFTWPMAPVRSLPDSTA